MSLAFILSSDDAQLNIVGSEYANNYNYPIIEMEMSFDNGEYNYFNFRQFLDHFCFVIYDRFKGTTNQNAKNMLKQMATKNKLTIRYKNKKGSTQTYTFNLEGLEALLDAMFE